MPTNQKILKRRMVNYLSIGGDARVGLGFEKHRSSSMCWNKCCHCWEGFKKLCCVSTMGMNDVMMGITRDNEEEEEIVIVAAKNYAKESESYLTGNPASIMFSNIGSLMGARSKPWKTSGNNSLGVENKLIAVPNKFKEENFGDNLIEIVAFPSQLSISLETMFAGYAQRITQDPGPFSIVFQKSTVIFKIDK